MSYLPEVEDTVNKTIGWIKADNNPVDPGKCWAALNVGHDIIMTQWLEKGDDIVDTLIHLLSNSDRRVVVLAIVFIGLAQDIRGDYGLRRGGISRAIAPIWNVVSHSNDNNLGIAVGVTNAILGDRRATEWMSQQLNVTHESKSEFIKTTRLGIVLEIAKGWR